LDLLDQELLLVLELVILFVVLKVGEERDETLFVLQKDVEDGSGLVGVGHKDLEDVERLELDVLALVSQQQHHRLEIGHVADVARHDVEVCTIQQELSQKLEGLAFGDIVGGGDEEGVAGEDVVVFALEELGAEGLVLGEQLFERHKGVRGNVKVGDLDKREELDKAGRVEHDSRELLMSQTLSQDQS